MGCLCTERWILRDAHTPPQSRGHLSCCGARGLLCLLLDVPNWWPTNQDIYFIFNAQHDCKGGGCQPIEARALQDCEETSIMELAIEHSKFDHYVLNLHAHHNSWRLQKVLPRNLTAPVPYVLDRKKLHVEAAQELQKNKPGKASRGCCKSEGHPGTKQKRIKAWEEMKWRMLRCSVRLVKYHLDISTRSRGYPCGNLSRVLPWYLNEILGISEHGCQGLFSADIPRHQTGFVV